jgi:hypothetical protein
VLNIPCVVLSSNNKFHATIGYKKNLPGARDSSLFSFYFQTVTRAVDYSQQWDKGLLRSCGGKMVATGIIQEEGFDLERN